MINTVKIHQLITSKPFTQNLTLSTETLLLSQDKGKMFFDVKKAVAFFNIIFSIIFLIHITSIGYNILYPEVPETVVYNRNLKEIDFPMNFRICVHELYNSSSRYQRFGYY